MTHPDQLFTPQAPTSNLAGQGIAISDLSQWRDMDLLDLLEFMVQLIQSEQWEQDRQTLLEQAHNLAFPTSLTLLLLNSLNRLERIAEANPKTSEVQGNRFRLDTTSLKAFMAQMGISKEYSNRLQSDQPTQVAKDTTVQVVHEVQPKQPPIEQPAQDEPKKIPELAIVPKTLPNGRAWTISGKLIAEVTYNQLGYTAKMYAGDFCHTSRPYPEMGDAANQARLHTEGVLKLLKIVPR